MGIEIGFAIGTVIVLAALVYGTVQFQRRDPRQEARTDAATRRVYETTER